MKLAATGARWTQFSLLVAINAFVGAMLGLERTLLPLVAEQEFGLVTHKAILSYVVAFGIAKAISNCIAGQAADRFGRRRMLLAGWALAVPVPFLLMAAGSWGWILFANLLLGISQGLSWTSTAVMKMDLAGPRRRGLAMGLNESAGYTALALSALATSHVAARYGLRPEPFFLGIGFVLIGGGLSLFFVRETRTAMPGTSFAGVCALWRKVLGGDRILGAATQAGFVTNLKDGMCWGLLPLHFAERGLSLQQSGWLIALYVGVWGIMQSFTGALSDALGRRNFIVTGMVLQAIGISATAGGYEPSALLLGAVAMGLGTAMVYPTLLAVVGDRIEESRRASALGVYRFWRDLGYAAGAILSGVLGDLLGIAWAMAAVALLTGASGGIAFARLRKPVRTESRFLLESQMT